MLQLRVAYSVAFLYPAFQPWELSSIYDPIKSSTNPVKQNTLQRMDAFSFMYCFPFLSPSITQYFGSVWRRGGIISQQDKFFIVPVAKPLNY